VTNRLTRTVFFGLGAAKNPHSTKIQIHPTTGTSPAKSNHGDLPRSLILLTETASDIHSIKNANTNNPQAKMCRYHSLVERYTTPKITANCATMSANKVIIHHSERSEQPVNVNNVFIFWRTVSTCTRYQRHGKTNSGLRFKLRLTPQTPPLVAGCTMRIVRVHSFVAPYGIILQG